MKVVTLETKMPTNSVRFVTIAEIGGFAAIASGYTRREAFERATRLGSFRFGYSWKEGLLKGVLAR